MHKLYEDRARVWHQMEALKESITDWSAEDTGKFEAMETELQSITKKIDAGERFSALAAPQSPPVPQINVEPTKDEQTAQHNAAFSKFLRHGVSRLTADEAAILHAMSTTIGSEGGYLVPEQMRAAIIEALLDFGGVLPLVETITTDNGQEILIPKNDDTANTGEWIGQNTEVSDLDLDFESVRLGAHIASSKAVRIPISLVQDSAIEIEPFVGRKLGERIGRLSATAWIHGPGTGEPEGLVFGRDTGKDVNTTAAITFDNLQDLIRKVDPAYRRMPGTSFVMNDTVAGAVRKLKTGISGDNTTLWQPSMQAGQPDMLLGFPVVIDQEMDNDAATGGGSHATGVPVLFGNFREAYIVRQVRQLMVVRLDQTRARFHQIEYVGFLRQDGGVKNTAAYAGLERAS